MSPSPTRISEIAALLLLAVFVGMAVASMRQKSPTWDETHYLGLGAYLLKERRWDVPSARLHPPLSYYLNSLPLLLDGVDVSGFAKGGPARFGLGIARGRELLATSRFGPEGLIFRARLPTVLIGALLGWFVFRWSRELYGWPGGLLSVFLYALSPNLLAHARLATPDLCLTAFGFIGFYCWRHALASDARRSRVAAGVCLGLALLSKYSALLWLPLYAGIALGALPPRALARRLVPAFAIAGLVVAAGYALRADEYVRGLATQLLLVSSGREPSFLDGEVSHDGWWYYYLYALAVKLPLATLLLLAARALVSRLLPGAGGRETAFLLAPPAAFLGAFSLAGSVNNGLRYVLPILPFLLVWIGGVTAVLSRAAPRVRAVGAATLATLAAWYAAGSAAIHPHPLAYFNELVGGPANGYRHLVDSNLDWGQDLPGLAAWLAAHPVAEVKLCYFGTADPADYGIAYRPLPGCGSGPGRRPAREIRPGELIAVSATHLYPLFADLGELARSLRAREPIARIGYSIHLYRSERGWRLPAPGPPLPGARD